MPKRIPTPPPGDDEPRYLTVVHPYVLDGHCNMELPKDRQDFARWVACCIDAKYFYAFFHKPSARDMVIIEIARECPQLDRLLGEHRWREFLKKSTEQEQDQVTKVFYCTYSTGRQVQKNGWKRIFVEDAWFKTWSPNNHLITFPYPETHFCEVPIEDQTNHPMCRPLPGAVKPPPPETLTAPAPVVGSRQWTTDKRLPAPIAKAGAWAKGAPKSTAPVGNAWKAAIATSSPAISGLKKQPAVGGGPIAVKAADVWVGIPAPSGLGPNGWSDSPIESGRNTPTSGAPSPLPRTISNQSPIVPPGLSGQKAWTAGTSYPTHPPGIPALPNAWGVPRIETAPSLDRDNTSVTSWSSNGGSSGGSIDIVLTPEDDPYKVQVQISESMERAMDGLSVHHDLDPNLAELDSIAPGSWNEPMSTDVWSDYPIADGVTWDDAPADAEAQWKELNDDKDEEKIVCNAHGVICKKGICREYAKQARDAERAQKDATAGNKKGRGRGRGRGHGRGGGEGGGTDRGGAPNSAFRGRGAPVKSNWRGTPRAIVSAAAIERRESINDAESVAVETPNAWGNTSVASWNVGEDASEEVAEPAGNDAPEPSDDGWGKSVASFDPWLSVPAKPKPQQRPAPQFQQRPAPQFQQRPAPQFQQRQSQQRPQSQSQSQWRPPPQQKPVPQQKAQPNTNAWSNKKASTSWADQVDAHSAAGYPEDDGFSTVSSKRGGRAKAPKSSTSGWGTVDEKPW